MKTDFADAPAILGDDAHSPINFDLGSEAKGSPDQLDEASSMALRFVSDPQPSDVEFERLLDELSAGPAVSALPDDWSRADLYGDRD